MLFILHGAGEDYFKTVRVGVQSRRLARLLSFIGFYIYIYFFLNLNVIYISWVVGARKHF